MNNKQPEALRLADAIEDWNMGDWSEREVAATLRTQHALLERALEAMAEVRHRSSTVGYAKAACWHAVSDIAADLTAHLEPKP